MARRLSIHRALTLGSRSPRPHVILRNTNGDGTVSRRASTALNLHRSKSLSMVSSKLYILTPSRGERMRLELLIADIGSRELLAFPGAPQRTRSELRARRSTSTMMRKMSLSRRSSTSQISRSIGGGASLRGLKRPYGRLSQESLRCEGDNITTKTCDSLAQPDYEEQIIHEEESEPEPPEPELVQSREIDQKDGSYDDISVEDMSKADALNIPILRIANTNNFEETKSSGSLRSPSQVSQKENSRQSMDDRNRSWAKVSSMRGEVKGHHGFRSMFR